MWLSGSKTFSYILGMIQEFWKDIQGSVYSAFKYLWTLTLYLGHTSFFKWRRDSTFMQILSVATFLLRIQKEKFYQILKKMDGIYIPSDSRLYMIPQNCYLVFTPWQQQVGRLGGSYRQFSFSWVILRLQMQQGAHRKALWVNILQALWYWVIVTTDWGHECCTTATQTIHEIL